MILVILTSDFVVYTYTYKTYTYKTLGPIGLNSIVLYFSFRESMKNQLQSHSKRASLMRKQFSTNPLPSHFSFMYNSCDADLADIQLTGKYNKGISFSLDHLRCHFSFSLYPLCHLLKSDKV